ncbi:twin-arginine translocase subunit TatC [uncultured Amnibacterium sp.]|uniref:twin-arginine translocase subunit TatC n=1 Tax=uncultured Amnibacterium sp. TaxID=1631851 RepID=UPI0035CAA9C0
MPLVQHLLELRKRLMLAALGVVLGAVAGWFVAPTVLQSLSAPLRGEGSTSRLSSATYTNITSAFDVQLEIAIIVGIVLSSPLWLYQIFAFFTPAFTRTEKRYVFGFFFSAVPLFLIGCASGWLLIPHIVTLMTGFAAHGAATLIDFKGYLDFALRLMLVIGIAFVLPVFLVLLNFIGVVSGVAIMKAWRIAILAITLFTAIATPSADVISMLLLAIPMVVLYFVAVGVTIVHDRRVAARQEALLSSDVDAL